MKTQLDVMAAEGITHIELRGIWGKSVMKQNKDGLDRVKIRLNGRGFKVSLIGSLLGNVKSTDDFARSVCPVGIDAMFDTGRVVPAGEGDGEVRELLQVLEL